MSATTNTTPELPGIPSGLTWRSEGGILTARNEHGVEVGYVAHVGSWWTGRSEWNETIGDHPTMAEACAALERIAREGV